MCEDFGDKSNEWIDNYCERPTKEVVKDERKGCSLFTDQTLEKMDAK